MTIRAPRLRAAVAILSAAVLVATLSPVTAAAGGHGVEARPHRAAGVGRPETRPPVRPGEVIVKAAPGSGRGLQRALSRAGGRVTAALGGGTWVASVAHGDEVAAAARLAADPAIAYAEPNYMRATFSHVDAEMGWGIRRLRVSALWRRSPAITGTGIRVAVVDSGVDRTAAELAGRVAPGRDVYGGNGKDDCGHGTAVAGVVAAAHDGRDVAGAAPGATIVPVKVLRYDPHYSMCGGDDAAIVEGIRWAATPQPHGGGADVINLSFGGPQPSAAMRDAIVYAARQGALIVAASGNSGDRAVHYPAAYPQVIAVGGIQLAGSGVQWWPQSSFGAVDIAAPAKDVPVVLPRSIDPFLVAHGCPRDRSRWCADGTSFAAPHVAGVAALLHQQHPGLRQVAAGARLRRLRQWLLGTAPRVPGTSPGLDLRAGHGRPDALAAATTSTDSAATLLTWQAPGRVIAPTRAMTAMPWRLPAQLIVTRGTGAGLSGRTVRFSPSAGGSVSTRSTTTNAAGRAAVAFSSRAHGRLARLTATVGGTDHALAMDSYVLHRDDNIPGMSPRRSPFRGRLRVVDDVDDVFRFPMYARETLHAGVTEIDRPRERVVLYLHRPGTQDVTNPFLAPLPEDGSYGRDPQRLKVTAADRGVHYLDVYGHGTYRLRWWIYVPGRIRGLAAAPSPFSPDGDGRADTTRIAWRSHRAGQVTLVIRNSAGRLVRAMALGRLPKGGHALRWAGRKDNGVLVRDGVFTVRVEWSNGRGRRSWSTTKVSVRR